MSIVNVKIESWKVHRPSMRASKSAIRLLRINSLWWTILTTAAANLNSFYKVNKP
jgi:hypothetical protein